MIGHEFSFGIQNLHELGVVEFVETEQLSNELIFHDVAHRPSRYNGRYHNIKGVTVMLRIFEDKYDRRNLESVVEEIVMGLYSEEPQMMRWNNKYANGILRHVNSVDYYGATGYIELVFVNLDGLWVGEGKNAATGSTITINGNYSTKYATITITPTMNDVEVTLGTKGIYLTGVEPNRPLVIDLLNKTAKQDGKHVSMALHSNFFELTKGANTITVKNGSGTVSYREVVAL